MAAPRQGSLDPTMESTLEPDARIDAAPPPGDAAVAVAPSATPMAWAIVVFAVIAIVAALYLARAFFVPLLIGILASYALRPFVDWLHARRVPRAAGAAMVLALLTSAVGWATISVGDDAASVVAQLPEAVRKVRQQVVAARAGGPTSLQKIGEAATELQGAAADATNDAKPAKPFPRTAPIREAEQSPWLRDYVLAQSALLFTVLAQAPIVLLLTYFLLASGEHFRRTLVRWMPSLSQKKDAVRLLEEIDVQIQRYLLATLGSNVLVGAGTWLAFWALGVEQPGVWGAAAGVLHFIPYLGPVLFAVASGLAAFMQFGTASEALMVAGASLLVATVVGSIALTWVQSRLARLNAAVLFIGLLFFGWLWGVWGLLLGAPLVAIAKVICDRVESLQPAGELLGH